MTRDEFVNPQDLAIVEKFEKAVAYLYPIFQRCPRSHSVLRDRLIGLLFDQVGFLYQAAKSKQASKLYAADANLATLRSWLRFASSPDLNSFPTTSTRWHCATSLKRDRCSVSGSDRQKATGGRGHDAVASVHLWRLLDQRRERRLPVRELGLLARELEREHRGARRERRPIHGSATVTASPVIFHSRHGGFRPAVKVVGPSVRLRRTHDRVRYSGE